MMPDSVLVFESVTDEIFGNDNAISSANTPENRPGASR
jgi:hypothetical protein